jgi:hypothetical protein
VSQPAATEELYVRATDPDLPAYAMRLGGNWVWNFGDERCMTSVEAALAANPAGEGFCTQVGLVADNPGYDPDAIPAPPLREVLAQAGDC